jgi:type IX secretion system PorP/SprF family membrane protein
MKIDLDFYPLKRIVFALTFLTFIVVANGQQDPQYSQNMFNTMSVNPGYAGSNDAICASLIHRQQWVGFDGAPVTSDFNVNAAIKPFKVNSGIALGVMKDKLGYDNDIDLKFAYAYRASVGDGKLGIGVGVEVLNKSLNATWTVPESGGFTQPTGDPSIPKEKESATVVDFSAGVFYRTEKLYLGVSSTHLRQAEINYEVETKPFLARQYYLTTGYTIALPNPLFELQPSVFVKSDGKTTQLDLNTCVLYNKRFWGGLSYRLNDAVVGMVGVELSNGLKLGYSYDFTISDMHKNSSGSHEFMIGYCFSVKKDKAPQKYKSIRFL